MHTVVVNGGLIKQSESVDQVSGSLVYCLRKLAARHENSKTHVRAEAW